MRPSCLSLGVIAFYAGRTEVARPRALTMSISYHELLVVERGRNDLIDDWAKAYLGLASLMVFHGDDAGADAVVEDMGQHLRSIDPTKAGTWGSTARTTLEDLRTNRQ